MFQPHRFTINPVILDFSSSGQGSHSDFRLLADGELLANAVGLVEWADDPVQVHVCEACGVTRCETGGWLAFRRVGSAVVLIPAFEQMAENEQEYRPPALILQHGFGLLFTSDYASLRIHVPEL